MKNNTAEVSKSQVLSNLHNFKLGNFKSRTFDGSQNIRDLIDKEHKDELEYIQKIIDEAEPDSSESDSFRVTENGLFYISYEKSKNSNAVKETEIFVCAPVRVLGTGKDADGREKTLIVEFQDDDGRTRQTFLSIRDLYQDPKNSIADLASQGLIIDINQKNRLLEYITKAKAEKRYVFTYRTGWHGDSFVFPDEVFSKGESNLILQGENTIANKLKTGGSLAEWQENVSKYCAGNSRLIFSVSCAFAAVLLPLANQLGGGFHLRGTSSEGKSSALKVAGSVFGCGSKEHGFSETWRSTHNGLEAIAENHNHLLLPLDEIKEVLPPDIGKIIYMLSNGFGKQRMTKNITARRKAEWLLLFLSSGELSFRDITRETKERVFGGQEARFVDIPASVENGFGIYETLHGFNNGAELSAHLNKASVSFFGTASREFIKNVVENLEDVKSDIKQTVDNFIQKHVPKGASGEIYRVAERFALVAFAGWFATKCGVTGWNESEPLDVPEKIFQEWVIGRGGLGSFDVSDGCRKILSLIDKRSNSDFQDLDNLNFPKPQTRIGYKRRAETGGGTEFIFTASQMSDLCAGYNQNKILHELERIGHLKTYNHEKSRSKTLRITLPDFATRQYVYVLTIQNQSQNDGDD